MRKKIRNRFYKKLNFYRKVVQIFSLLFLIIIPVLVMNGIYNIIGNMYSFTIFGVDIVDPAMAIQTTILSMDLTYVVLAGVIIPIVLALFFGKVFCSWMCPFNTLSEYWQILTKKIFRKRYRRSRLKNYGKNPKAVYYWIILLSLFAMSILLGFPLITFLSAPGIISSEIAHIIMGMGAGLELLIFLSIIFVEGLFFKRYWCKYICPVGGILSVFRFKNTLHIEVNEKNCTCASNVEPCSFNCPFDLSPKKGNIYPFCFNCGQCIKTCEKTGNNALKFSFGIGKNREMEEQYLNVNIK